MSGVAKVGPVTTTSNNLPSSSNSRVPGSGNHHTAAFRRHHRANCSSSGGVCRCEHVGERGNGSFVSRVLGPIPSRFEVESAIAALQSVLHGISSSGSDSGQRIMETQRYSRVHEAFRLLQTDPSVQRMVMSLSSDKAVWDAVLNNKMVRELQRPLLISAEEGSLKRSSEEPDVAALILRWILEITRAKIMELVEKFQSLVNEVFQSSGREGGSTTPVETSDQLDERVVSSTFLAIVILLIVVVARAQGA